ncbi:hypothetical protein D9M68_919430 [compost metagenome]
MEAMKKAQQQRMGGSTPKTGATGSSFLDDWLAKRQQMGATGSVGQSTQVPQAPSRREPARPFEPAQSPVSGGMSSRDNAPVQPPVAPGQNSVSQAPVVTQQPAAAPKQAVSPDKLHLRGEHASRDDEISIKIR